ncbi:adenine phosphoribosyltransferase [Patulibacter brassicae]|uniref:Adenine phosphoribosyltransferase n=1 Tax=Patulibacter brassicae TaxID=1705717 RepID=A0ABU4VH26_9ACTN|nr:adenine phosphoribosyltransferase [Patulibacter brassicae]MDX8150241.1 adenine phosphoribosyltransferase [Patulibacter brassicae]
MSHVEEVAARIVAIPDHPEPGVTFRDITPVFADPAALAAAVHHLTDVTRDLGVQRVIAAEARGFLLGPALALELGAGFLLARKPGKLPRDTLAVEYALEYGSDQLEVHADLLEPGTRVLVHDDLLATGGTAEALCRLVEDLGGEVVACSFLVELSALGGRARLAPHAVHSLVTYD